MDAPLQLELAKALDTLALLVGLGGFFLGAIFGHVLRRVAFRVLHCTESKAVRLHTERARRKSLKQLSPDDH